MCRKEKSKVKNEFTFDENINLNIKLLIRNDRKE